MRRFSGELSLVMATWLFAISTMAENWSQFRGENVNGVAAETMLPVAWGPSQQIAWKVKLPGVGWSQPIVWRNKIFVTTAESDKQAKPDPNNTGPGFDGFAGLLSAAAFGPKPPDAHYRWTVLCLDATTGNVVWEQVAHEGRPAVPIHANNTYASETPATDGERLIAYFGMMGVYCYDLSGELLWSKDLGSHPTQFGWGTGSSAVLFGELVYIQCDNDEASFLVALDKKSGETVWRVGRKKPTGPRPISGKTGCVPS